MPGAVTSISGYECFGLAKQFLLLLRHEEIRNISVWCFEAMPAAVTSISGYECFGLSKQFLLLLRHEENRNISVWCFCYSHSLKALFKSRIKRKTGILKQNE